MDLQKRTIFIYVILIFVVCALWTNIILETGTIGLRQHAVNSAVIIKKLKQTKDPLAKYESPKSFCECRPSRSSANKKLLLKSTCNKEVDELGVGQSVVSFSLFASSGQISDVNEAYFNGIKENLLLMKRFYPGWRMRLYTNISITEEVCKIICYDTALDYCNIEYAQGKNVTSHPMTWRFLPLGDPTVKIFISRDLDSRIWEREVQAVNEWQKSNFSLHAMRDHPWHGAEVLRGMWGADNDKFDRNASLALSTQIQQMDRRRSRLNDQGILTQTAYKYHSSDFLVHDSYLCARYGNSKPFPIQRPNEINYVGEPHYSGTSGKAKLPSHCPKECRPLYGKNWKYC